MSHHDDTQTKHCTQNIKSKIKHEEKKKTKFMQKNQLLKVIWRGDSSYFILSLIHFYKTNL